MTIIKQKKIINDELLIKNNLIYIDIGASGGVQPKWLNQTKKFKSILFEPNKKAYDKLVQNKKKHEIIIQAALSDSKNNLNINICKDPQSSSFYEPNYQFLEKFNNFQRFEIVSKENIETQTLDYSLNEQKISDVDFIKIDTQGYELNILKGSEKILQEVIGIETECELTQMYLNQPLFSKILDFLLYKNFSLFDIKKYFWKRDGNNINNSNKGQLIFIDALFLKQPEEIIENFKNNKKKLIKTIYVYKYYKYTDLAKIIIDYMKDNKMLDYKELEILNKNITIIETNKFSLPDFPGKLFIRKILVRLSNIFLPNKLYSKTYEWNKGFYSGNDQDLGN